MQYKKFHLKKRNVPVAIVRRGPHREDRLVEMPLVPLHDQLMGPADHVDVVSGIELRHDVRTK